MGEYREFMTLTDGEIRQIVTDIFQPKKLTCIERHKKDGYISCKIYSSWTSKNDDGTDDTVTIADVVELREPFVNGSRAIKADFAVYANDYVKLKKFCLAKGICEYLKDNPYLADTTGCQG